MPKEFLNCNFEKRNSSVGKMRVNWEKSHDPQLAYPPLQAGAFSDGDNVPRQGSRVFCKSRHIYVARYDTMGQLVSPDLIF